ncbi:MAG: hypothetical protein RLZZ450_6386 [Pseudomonadota bacterium]
MIVLRRATLHSAFRAFVFTAEVFGVSWLSGCGDPLVGLECRDGYERCGHGCYALTDDHDHCGGCNIACSTAEMCVLSMCVPAAPTADGGGDGGDGGTSEAGTDGGTDGGTDASRDADIDAHMDGGDGNDLDGGNGMDGSGGDARTDADARSADADSDARTGDATINLPDGAVLLPDGAILLPDGGIFTPGDGGGGSGDNDGSTGDAGVIVTPPALCTGPGSPPDCVCGLGTTKCGNVCINTNTDHENCGGCVPPTPPQVAGVACAADEYCNQGVCSLICTPPVTLCGGLCVDLLQDDANCGMCGMACGNAAACIAGTCEGQAVGHVVVVGHDMSVVTRPIRQIVANAVFLAPRTPVRVLAYDATTSLASRAGVSLAIQQGSTTIGRAYTLTTANPATITQQLGDADVFVIEVQQDATDTELLNLGALWSAALHTFLFRGGVILLFDGGTGMNVGTYQILKAATEGVSPAPVIPLFDATARIEIPQRIVGLVLANASDVVAAGVSTVYQSQGGTVGFVMDPMAVNPGKVVVQDPPALMQMPATVPANLPVVIHAVTVQ